MSVPGRTRAFGGAPDRAFGLEALASARRWSAPRSAETDDRQRRPAPSGNEAPGEVVAGSRSLMSQKRLCASLRQAASSTTATGGLRIEQKQMPTSLSGVPRNYVDLRRRRASRSSARRRRLRAGSSGGTMGIFCGGAGSSSGARSGSPGIASGSWIGSGGGVVIAARYPLAVSRRGTTAAPLMSAARGSRGRSGRGPPACRARPLPRPSPQF